MKTVCLVEISNGGHREAFMQLFVKALIESGNQVVCIMPDTTEVNNWIKKNHPEFINKIQYFSIQYPHDNTTKFNKIGVFLKALSVWKYYKRELKKIEKKSASTFDLVFWNCLDGYVFNYFPGFVIEYIFPYKWSGLYFHPNTFRLNPEYLKKTSGLFDIDNCFKSKNCVAVTIHDEGILEGFQNRINKKVLLFPEIADDTLPNPANSLAKKIKEKAKDRIIIGMIGLEYHKGAFNFMKLCKIADPDKYFFVFTGDYSQNIVSYFPPDHRDEFILFKDNLPENCLWQTGKLKEGEEYNSIFCSFDIIYIVYKNFYSSSNRLTKAAIFNKLVLASKNGCVGDDVPRYNLGETADENNIEEQLNKLEVLRNLILVKNFPYKQWKIYAEKHSTERLKERFTEILNLV